VVGVQHSVFLLSLEDQTLRELLAPSGHRTAICSLELTHDGSTLVSTGWNEYARVWTFDGRRFVPTAQTSSGKQSFITPTGDYVIAGGTIFQLDPAGLNPVKQLNGLPLCLSGDGKTLAVDGLGIVDLAGTLSQERLRLPVAKQPSFADLNRDGSLLAAYFAGDKHVTWWDLREKDPQPRQIPCDIALPNNLKWTPDGQSLILVGGGGIVAWDWNQGQPRERRRRVEPFERRRPGGGTRWPDFRNRIKRWSGHHLGDRDALSAAAVDGAHARPNRPIRPRRPAPAAGLRQRRDRSLAPGAGPRGRRIVTVNMVSEGVAPAA
jgi:hypothetical protein